MSHGRYIPVANEPPVRPSDEEMEQAFESDDGDLVSAPLTQPSGHQQQGQASLGQQQEGFVYDFEREYDHPPPGSPPEQASAFTHTIGNTNGVIPNPANVVRNFPTPTSNRPSFFRRAVGALLPQHYARVPTSDAIDVHGSGIENDGVFSNVLAKPSPRTVRTSDGEIQEMPEDAQKDVPPVRMQLGSAIPRITNNPTFRRVIMRRRGMPFHLIGRQQYMHPLAALIACSFMACPLALSLHLRGISSSRFPSNLSGSCSRTSCIQHMRANMVLGQDWASLLSSTDFSPAHLTMTMCSEVSRKLKLGKT